MRGKKTDPVFISQFIQESVRDGVTTTDEIIKRAKTRIEQIDAEIKSIEGLKIMRSKLLDVISSFEKPVSKDKTEEAKLLPFFNLQYPEKCKEICDVLRNGAESISLKIENATTVFCFKQLLEHKILARKDYSLIPGERFNEYITFVLREGQ